MGAPPPNAATMTPAELAAAMAAAQAAVAAKAAANGGSFGAAFPGAAAATIGGGMGGMGGGGSAWEQKKAILEAKKKLLWGNKKKEVEAEAASQGAHANQEQWRAASGNIADSAKFLKMMGDRQGAAAVERRPAGQNWTQPKVEGAAGEGEDGATRVLSFNHGYDRSVLLEPEEVEGIKQDIREEAERVSNGKVLALELPTPASGPDALAGIGFVYIAFGDIKSCRAAHYALNGRNFNAQVVACHYFEEMKFAKGVFDNPGKIKMLEQAKQKQVWNQLEQQFDMGIATQQSRSGLGSWQYRAPTSR